MDKVAQDRQPLIITKHGKPMVQVTPIPAQENIVGSMKGSVLWLGDVISPIDVEWDAMK
jgi:prevent-host-death family protein